MNVDTQNHQAVINREGATVSILIPYEDYQEMMDVLRRAEFLISLKADIHQSMTEIKEAKEGKRSLQSLQSLLDES